jgi:hypothetical protein
MGATPDQSGATLIRAILALLFVLLSGSAWVQSQCSTSNWAGCPGNSGPALYDSLSVNPANPIIGSTQATGGNTPIMLANRAAFIVDPLDYGAACNWNGTSGTDDTVALQAAINKAATNNGEVDLPRTPCKISAALAITGNVTIRGQGCFANSGSVAISYYYPVGVCQVAASCKHPPAQMGSISQEPELLLIFVIYA